MGRFRGNNNLSDQKSLGRECHPRQNINTKEKLEKFCGSDVSRKFCSVCELCESMSSFSDMRNLLLFLYHSKCISDEEFLTLYESYSSKNPDFPYSAYPKFDYDQMDESEYLVEFTVRKQDVTMLANVLRLPVTICCHQIATCD